MSRPAPQVRITVETGLDPEMAERYYELYHATFSDLETQAVARQLLTRQEFLEEMQDPRVLKYTAWDGDRAIGVTTLTRHLETVPWISPRYFEHHYPEFWARDAVYYLGLTLVDRQHQRHRVFEAMIAAATERILAERAVCAWDICHFNDRVLGLGPAIARMLDVVPELAVGPIDTQTYFAAVHRSPGAGPGR